MKWITSTDIKQWADRRDAQSILPELVARLIRATASNITQIRFPAGDAVHLTGWDEFSKLQNLFISSNPGYLYGNAGQMRIRETKPTKIMIKEQKTL